MYVPHIIEYNMYIYIYLHSCPLIKCVSVENQPGHIERKNGASHLELFDEWKSQLTCPWDIKGSLWQLFIHMTWHLPCLQLPCDIMPRV